MFEMIIQKLKFEIQKIFETIREKNLEFEVNQCKVEKKFEKL